MTSPRIATYSIDGSIRYGAVTDSGIVVVEGHRSSVDIASMNL